MATSEYYFHAMLQARKTLGTSDLHFCLNFDTRAAPTISTTPTYLSIASTVRYSWRTEPLSLPFVAVEELSATCQAVATQFVYFVVLIRQSTRSAYQKTWLSSIGKSREIKPELLFFYTGQFH